MEITTWKQLEDTLGYIALGVLLVYPVGLMVVSVIYHSLDTGK